jgi:hypothetical protein
MTHEHGHHPHHHGHGERPRAWWKQAHKDWRIWVAVVLMLISMVVYVLSMDESVRPGGNVEPRVPAAP